MTEKNTLSSGLSRK